MQVSNKPLQFLATSHSYQFRKKYRNMFSNGVVVFSFYISNQDLANLHRIADEIKLYVQVITKMCSQSNFRQQFICFA
jgi:hypothetical protein